MSVYHSTERSRVAINNSMSKQMYSFYNSPRFTLREKNSNCFYYNLPSVKSPRAASIGFGTKTEFERSTQSNGKLYDVHDLNTTMYRSPMYSFGLGREHCKNYSNLSEGIRPEPASYDIKPMFSNQALKYSIRKKLNPKQFNINPGPGAYNSLDFNPKGYYPVSHIVNELHLPFSLAKEIRFKFRSCEVSPSPVSYNIQSSFNGTGKKLLSQYFSNISKTMGVKPKDVISKKESPGPGHYSHFRSFSGFHD